MPKLNSLYPSVSLPKLDYCTTLKSTLSNMTRPEEIVETRRATESPAVETLVSVSSLPETWVLHKSINQQQTADQESI